MTAFHLRQCGVGVGVPLDSGAFPSQPLAHVDGVAVGVLDFELAAVGGRQTFQGLSPLAGQQFVDLPQVALQRVEQLVLGLDVLGLLLDPGPLLIQPPTGVDGVAVGVLDFELAAVGGRQTFQGLSPLAGQQFVDLPQVALQRVEQLVLGLDVLGLLLDPGPLLIQPPTGVDDVAVGVLDFELAAVGGRQTFQGLSPLARRQFVDLPQVALQRVEQLVLGLGFLVVFVEPIAFSRRPRAGVDLIAGVVQNH